MKKMICITVALLLAFILLGCAGVSANNNYGKDDRDIIAHAGKTFTITLEENPSTGYAWTVDISDKTVVSLENEEYRQEPGSEDIAGAGGLKVLTFKGLKKGTAAITLVYERGFEEGSATDTLIYNITVK